MIRRAPGTGLANCLRSTQIKQFPNMFFSEMGGKRKSRLCNGWPVECLALSVLLASASPSLGPLSGKAKDADSPTRRWLHVRQSEAETESDFQQRPGGCASQTVRQRLTYVSGLCMSFFGFAIASIFRWEIRKIQEQLRTWGLGGPGGRGHLYCRYY